MIRASVKEMLDLGIIEECSSQWVSPVVITKKNGEYRFCVDYRRLNQITVKDHMSIPVIDELLQQMVGSKYFTTLDLKSGYWQISRYTKDSLHLQIWNIRFKVMPFGLTNAPATFQRTMTNLFRNVIDQFVTVYLDDITVYSASW